MRFYIPGPNKEKSKYLQGLGAVIINRPEAKKLIEHDDHDFATVVVVDNGNFDAAAFTDSLYDFDIMTGPSEERPLVLLKMNKKWVHDNCGFTNMIHRQNALIWWRGLSVFDQKRLVSEHGDGMAFELVSASTQKVTEIFKKALQLT